MTLKKQVIETITGKFRTVTHEKWTSFNGEDKLGDFFFYIGKCETCQQEMSYSFDWSNEESCFTCKCAANDAKEAAQKAAAKRAKAALKKAEKLVQQLHALNIQYIEDREAAEYSASRNLPYSVHPILS